MWGNSFVDIGMGLPCTMIVSHWGSGFLTSNSRYLRSGSPGMRHASSLSIQRPRHATCQRYFRSSGLGMRHASVTFDPAAPSCDMPATLSIQRPRHATCQRHFRSSGPVMRHASSLSIQRTGNRVASGTFDPAVPAIELPATLSTQRLRQSSCQRYFRSSGLGNRVASGTFDPAAPAIELPAALSIQRPRQPELPANKKTEIPYVELTFTYF